MTFFSFYHVNLHKILKILQGDIPVRIIKENKFTFSKILSEMFNFYNDSNNTFPHGLKKTELSLFTRQTILLRKLIIDPLVFYLFYLKLLI